jgi:RHS repeat-associated protein
VVEYIRYKPYGEVRGRYTSGGGTATTQYRYEFTTYETEITGSGLQYAGARFYDPALGMFLTHDPAREYTSPYAYVHWDPVKSGMSRSFARCTRSGLRLHLSRVSRDERPSR